jgi:hypothetical protein
MLTVEILCFPRSDPSGPANIPQLNSLNLIQQSQSQSHFTTGGLPPINSSWRQAPRDSRPEFLFSNWTLAVIVLMNILSDERMGLGPRYIAPGRTQQKIPPPTVLLLLWAVV